MDRFNKRLLLLASVLALLVGLGSYSFLIGLERKAVLEYTDEVVVAARDIPERVELETDMLSVKRVPQGMRHHNATANILDLVGRMTRAPLVAGEQVLFDRVHAPGTDAGLSFDLEEGYRAISIGINARTAVTHMLRAGDFVDVVVSYEPSPEVENPRSIIMLQNIQILAVGTARAKGVTASPEAETVTLAVRPEQAERLVWAEDYGNIRLLLRSAGDEIMVPTPGATGQTVPGR